MAQAELQRLLDGVRAALAQPHHQGGLPTQQTLRRVQAALAELQQLPDDAALPAAAPGAAQDAALDSVAALLDRLLAPPAQLFAGLGGGPCEPSSELKEQGGPGIAARVACGCERGLAAAALSSLLRALHPCCSGDTPCAGVGAAAAAGAAAVSAGAADAAGAG